ncbi:hypothetical protein pdam_00007561, partial [Pocillopora damicornis]
MRGHYDDWMWFDGTSLNESLWVSGYPTRDVDNLGCAYLSAGLSKIKNGVCKSHRYPLCQKRSEASLSNRSQTTCSSVLLPYESSLAIDKSYTTCFRSGRESNPWWQVDLDKLLYVISVVITDKVDCCPRDNGMISVRVLNSRHDIDSTCSKSMEYDGSLTEAKGVLRETWYRLKNYEAWRKSTMREHPLIQGPPGSRIVLPDFDAPIDLEDRYAQRLTAYLQVPQSGSYVFYAACDDSCELWKYNVIEFGFAKDNAESDESAKNRIPIISVKKGTRYLQWDRYEEQSSQPIFLEKCRIYRMEAYGKDLESNDHISVGMRRPNGDFERPILGKGLFWTKPVFVCPVFSFIKEASERHHLS